MKLKQLFQITAILMALFFSSQAAFAIRELGNNPFYSPAIQSEDELKSMLLENQGDVKEGLAKAGEAELFEPLITQLPEAEITQVQYSKGQRLEWMFYRKDGKGKVRVDKDVVWESDQPLESYEFFVDHDGQRYTMTVPGACGNLALVGVGPVPIIKTPVAAPIEPAGEPVVGTPIARTAPEAEQAAVEAHRFPILVDVGYLHQFDPAHHLFVRVGTEYAFNDAFSVIGMIGAAPRVSGDDGKTAFIADVFANYTFSRFYAGLGLGAWLTSGDSDNDAEDSDLDLIANFGARIYGEPDAFNTSVFIEARSGIDELDDFDLYGRIGGGLRFRF